MWGVQVLGFRAFRAFRVSGFRVSGFGFGVLVGDLPVPPLSIKLLLTSGARNGLDLCCGICIIPSGVHENTRLLIYSPNSRIPLSMDPIKV